MFIPPTSASQRGIPAPFPPQHFFQPAGTIHEIAGTVEKSLPDKKFTRSD